MIREELEKKIIERLRQGGIESPALEARWMLDHWKAAQDISEFEAPLTRRLTGEPLAYILETQGFYGHEFKIRPGVLIPRPETELVVEVGAHHLREHPSAQVIYDLGCGSGCIGLSLLKEFEYLRLYGWDQSATAVAVSCENAQALSAAGNAKFEQVDLERFDFNGVPLADLVVSNPPYIAWGDPQVQKEVFQFEPHKALFSGPSGYELIHSWAKCAHSRLKSGGMLVMEVGQGQRSAVEKHLGEVGFSAILWHQDLAGIDRVVSAMKLP